MTSHQQNQWQHTLNHLKNELLHAPDESKEAAQKAVDDHLAKQPSDN